MKPRNKNEREVEQLRHSINDLDSPKRWRKSDWQWIKKNHKVGQTEYFAIYETMGDWQVIRMFMYRSWSKKHEAIHEPLRYWIKADGSFVVESKRRQCQGNYYIDAWIWDSEMAIRPSGGSRDVRNLYCSFSKVRSLIPELKRTGFRANGRIENGLMPFWLVRTLLTNNRVETFFKLRQTWLTWKFYHYDRLTETLWQSIRVALRHGYHWDNQQEINDWCDMIHDLEYLGLDTRSPHYICPANLDEAHQRITKLRYRKSEMERWAKEINDAEAYEPYFKATREQFFGMVLTDGEIEIKVIPTAKGIKEEGKAMHHCVGGYFNEPNSLILSATINGNRIETIEVDLTNYRLVQSRGLQNASTKYHNRIVDLVNDNLDTIRVLNVNHKKEENRKLRKLKKTA